jgi:hypothetical protein
MTRYEDPMMTTDETHAANIDRIHEYLTGILQPMALLDVHLLASGRYCAVLYNGSAELHVDIDISDLDE